MPPLVIDALMLAFASLGSRTLIPVDRPRELGEAIAAFVAEA